MEGSARPRLRGGCQSHVPRKEGEERAQPAAARIEPAPLSLATFPSPKRPRRDGHIPTISGAPIRPNCFVEFHSALPNSPNALRWSEHRGEKSDSGRRDSGMRILRPPSARVIQRFSYRPKVEAAGIEPASDASLRVGNGPARICAGYSRRGICAGCREAGGRVVKYIS